MKEIKTQSMAMIARGLKIFKSKRFNPKSSTKRVLYRRDMKKSEKIPKPRTMKMNLILVLVLVVVSKARSERLSYLTKDS